MVSETQISKTPMMLRKEKELGVPLEEAIFEAYERLGSIEAAGKELGIKPNTLYIWMIRLGLVIKREFTIVRR